MPMTRENTTITAWAKSTGNELLKAEYEARGDEEGCRECQANIDMARSNLFGEVDTKTWLRELTKNWQELASCAEGMGIP